jgi:3-hydroxybutyryl-CoA dehydrogenase
VSADNPNCRIAVVGAGRMGRGISLSFAFSGYAVQLCDSEERSAGDFSALAESVQQEIDTELDFLQQLQLVSPAQAGEIARRITVVSRPEAVQPLGDADFVFEAVAEVLDIKASTYCGDRFYHLDHAGRYTG